jgi:hypothetical protein
MGACKDAPAEEKESSVHWSYPEPPIVERSVLDEKLDRKEIFMLFTLDGQVQDTLWFKSQDKNRWASLLTVEALQSPKGAEKLTFSLPGEEAHVEFHWHNFEVGERVSMNFSDSVYPADYFRIVDRRENVHEASSQPDYIWLNRLRQRFMVSSYIQYRKRISGSPDIFQWSLAVHFANEATIRAT